MDIFSVFHMHGITINLEILRFFSLSLIATFIAKNNILCHEFILFTNIGLKITYKSSVVLAVWCAI